jgi:hypothetical protein
MIHVLTATPIYNGLVALSLSLSLSLFNQATEEQEISETYRLKASVNKVHKAMKRSKGSF